MKSAVAETRWKITNQSFGNDEKKKFLRYLAEQDQKTIEELDDNSLTILGNVCAQLVASCKMRDQMGGDVQSEEILAMALRQMYRVLVKVPGTDEVFQLKADQIVKLDFDAMVCSQVKDIATYAKRIAIFFVRAYEDVTLPSVAKSSRAQMLLHKHEMMSTWQELQELRDATSPEIPRKLQLEVQKATEG